MYRVSAYRWVELATAGLSDATHRVKCSLLVLFFFVYTCSGQSLVVSSLGKKELGQHDIYGIIQDLDNVLYIATDKGIIRYDGYEFTLLFQDAKIRSTSILSPKRNLKGEIFCSNLYGQIMKVVGDSLILYFEENIPENVLNTHFTFLDSNRMLVLGANLYHIESGMPQLLYRLPKPGYHFSDFFRERDKICFIHNDADNHVKVEISRNFDIETYKTPTHKSLVIGGISLADTTLLFDQTTSELITLSEDQSIKLSPIQINDGQVARYSIVSDQLFVLNSNSGFKVYTKNLEPNYEGRHFFKDRFISTVYQDNEGNYLLGTFGSGVLVVSSLNINKVQMEFSDFTEIETLDKQLYVSSKNKIIEFDPSFFPKLGFLSANRINKIVSISEQNLLFIDSKEDYILSTKNKISRSLDIGSIKDASAYSETHSLVANHIDVALLNLATLFVDSVIAVGRSQSVDYLAASKTIYYENINGFYCSDEDDKTLLFPKELLSVNDVLIANNACYVGTQNSGIKIVKGRDVLSTIHGKGSLDFNTVFTLKADKQFLYALTDIGIIKIDLKNEQIISCFPVEDLLENETILDMDVVQDQLCILTSESLYKIPTDSLYSVGCSAPLHLKYVRVNGENIDTEISSFDHLQSKFEFKLSAVTLRYKNEVNYEYKLDGIDETYQTNEYHNNKIIYKSLPPGTYTFTARTNWRGQRSKAVSYPFTISPPFWRTWLFYSLVIFCTGLITFVLIKWKIARIKRKNELKNELNLSKLIAIQSQMNPHFIFNAINSIQGLILNERTEESYNYVVKFSQLVRQTLSFSNKEFISFEDELSLLEVYLEIEKLRFQDDFQFEIETNNVAHIELPPMLIQPFVENAIKHGLLHKEGLKKVHISFELKDTLVCRIVDNGIGREESSRIKDRKNKTHTSFSTNATAKRLLIMNEHYEQQVRFTYRDLLEKEVCVGTEVTILMPYKES